MGCDIHGVIEARVAHWAEYYTGLIDAGELLDRNYCAFGELFGIRGTQFDEWPEIEVHKGLPHDYADHGISKFLWHYGKADAHSSHWVALEELEKIPTNTYPADWRFIIYLMQELRRQLDGRSVRLIVWFDN